MNARPIIFSTLIYVLQALPIYMLPLITAYIIDVVTASVEAGAGVSADACRTIFICAVLLLVVIAQNVPTTIWRFKIVSKMMRRTSAGIKSSVVRKLHSLSITYHKDMQSGKIQAKFLNN
jgi:ATP-binding cassette subfamily B protein